MNKLKCTLAILSLFILSACGTQAPKTHPFYAYGETPGEDPELIRLMRDEDSAAWIEYRQKRALLDQDPSWTSSLPSASRQPNAHPGAPRR